MILLLCCMLSLDSPYSAIYVFGDSYSDTGARYVDTNGPTAVAYLAERMGVHMTLPQDEHSKNSSLNFAASAAISGKEPFRTAKKRGGMCWCQQGMMDQVEDFARRVASGALRSQGGERCHCIRAEHHALLRGGRAERQSAFDRDDGR